jgi:hypothetical protein
MFFKVSDIVRFRAWRSGGFLAQKFNRRTALEPTTKLSYEALNPPLRQTAVIGWRSCLSWDTTIFMSFVCVICRVLFCRACVSGVLFFLKRWKKYFEILSWVGEVEALLQFLVCALDCANCKCPYTCMMAF